MEANGHTELATLKEKRNVLRIQTQIKQLERVQKLTEGIWWETFNGVGGFDRFGDSNGWLPVGGGYGFGSLSDRRRGDNWPLFRTETEHGLLRSQGRLICNTNSYAIGLLTGLTSYVIGTGYTYRVTSKDDAHDELVAKAQDIVDDFCDLNEWGELEAELFWRSREDGEYFLRHFAVDDGKTEVRTIEPEQVRNPPEGTIEQGWTYGLQHEMFQEDGQRLGDVQKTVQMYAADLDNLQRGEYLDPKDTVHCKVNGKRSIKRGLTDFCFATADAFENANRLRRAIGEGAAVQASTAEIWQHATATQAQVSALTAGQTDYSLNRPYPNGQTRQNNYQNLEPGTIRHIPSGMQLATLPGAAGQGAWAGYTEALQAVLRAAGVRWNAPEWLASGLHDTSSFASSLTAESPFVISVKRLQAFYKRRFRQSIEIALRNSIEAGKLPQGCMSVLEVQVEAPPIETRDPLKEAQVDSVYVQMGVKSIQTVTQELSLDYEQEQINREEYQQRTGGQGQGLDMPGDEPPGGGTPGMPGQGPPGAPPGTQPPGAAPKAPRMPGGANLADKVATESLREMKDDSGHEHKGKGPGGGQFGSGGGGGGAAPAAGVPDEHKAKVAAVLQGYGLSHKDHDAMGTDQLARESGLTPEQATAAGKALKADAKPPVAKKAAKPAAQPAQQPQQPQPAQQPAAPPKPPSATQVAASNPIAPALSDAQPDGPGKGPTEAIMALQGAEVGDSRAGAAQTPARWVVDVLKNEKFAGSISHHDVATVLDELNIVASGKLSDRGQSTVDIKNYKALRGVIDAAKTGEFNGQPVTKYTHLYDTAQSLMARKVRESIESFPDIRQTTDYSCGSACVSAVLQFYGITDPEEDTIRELNSSPSEGTRPEHLVTVFVNHGLECLARDRMTLDELWRQVEQGRPVICPVQLYGGGHYVVALSHDGETVQIQDPVGGPTTVEIPEFERIWMDTDADGNSYEHHGVSVYRRESPDFFPPVTEGYRPDEKRDEGGKWTSGGSSPKIEPAKFNGRNAFRVGDRVFTSKAAAEKHLKTLGGKPATQTASQPAAEPAKAATGRTLNDLMDYEAAFRRGDYTTHDRLAKQWQETPVPNEDKIAASAVQAAQSADPLIPPSIPDVYAAMKKESPGLTMDQAHAVLYRAHKSGAIRLSPHTRAPSTIPEPAAVMPVPGNNLYYVNTAKVKESKDSSGHEHKGKGEGGGQFTGGSGGGGKDTATAPPSSSPVNSPFASIKATASSAKDAADRIGKAAWDKLPPKMQRGLARTYTAAKAVEHKVMIGFAKGKEIAVQVAKERGLDPAQADKVGRILSAVDVGMAWTVNMPATFAATGSMAAAKAASWVPVASLAYIGYSTARNPAAVIRAAKTMIGKRAKESLESLLREAKDHDPDSVALLLTRLDEHPDDWYEALLVAALDENGGDIGKAVEAADAAYAEQSSDPEGDEPYTIDDDADAPAE